VELASTKKILGKWIVTCARQGNFRKVLERAPVNNASLVPSNQPLE